MRTWRLPAEVDTDQLAPGHAMKHGIEVIALHCLEGVRPEFAAGVRRGDVIVAGPHFGIGSSREQAASVLVHLGVAAVVAPSYAGLFFRNAFNVGLLLLTCDRAHEIEDGEALRFDARAGSITLHGGRRLAIEPIPEFLMEMIDAGGLLPQLKRRFAKDRPPNG
jgi:3-isopropylmalate/(R)-2-methylmalate dehydratase small subunit